ncbi:uncharacterized protein LOC123560327 [Mercenaria mercenaria]|uniref:uncharacterized protein LOC123560327 n=1 Tax=Mercenaria mercenaria TaxID=6596 RepID=UPI001E1DDA2D|nr:uncharacterized protein LOC123560327 [Mercenaria mercenaria]
MTKTHIHNVHDGIIYKGLLLDCSHTSGTELDYEYSESLLASEDHRLEEQTSKPDNCEVFIASVIPNAFETLQSAQLPPKEVLRHQPSPKEVLRPQSSPKEVLRLQQATKEVGLQVLSRSNVKDINKSYHEPKASDVLDLQRMADRFARAKADTSKGIGKIVYETSGFNYGVVTRVDKLLEEAYNMLHTFQKKLDFTTRTKLLNLILALNELPHLHDSTHREKGKCARVTDWLNNHTSQPEPELCGLTMQDPVQIRKFVADHIQPRVSTSDTNVTLGKRKRGCEDSCEDDIINVQKCSSDTRVHVHADWSRLRANGKRKRLRNN